MKIAFFEIEEWEEDFLQKKLEGHDISFDTDLISPETPRIDNIEILSVLSIQKVDKDLLSKMPQLKMIVTRSTGFDHIDIEACKARNIIVTNVPEYGTQTVAEHTFALLLALSRKNCPVS